MLRSQNWSLSKTFSSPVSRWLSTQPSLSFQPSMVGRPYGRFSGFEDLVPNKLQTPHHSTVSSSRQFSLALHHWVPVLQGRQVKVATDNTTVMFYINKQRGTSSYLQLRLVVDLFQTCELIPQHSSSGQTHTGMPQLIAVNLSRPYQPISTEWRLHPPEIAALIFECGVSPQWICLQQTTFLSYLSSCLQFQSPEHWRWTLYHHLGRGSRFTCFCHYSC